MCKRLGLCGLATLSIHYNYISINHCVFSGISHDRHLSLQFLCAPYLGPIDGVCAEGVAHFTGIGQLHRLLDKLVIDLLMHKRASARHTTLTHVGHTGFLGLGHC